MYPIMQQQQDQPEVIYVPMPTYPPPAPMYQPPYYPPPPPPVAQGSGGWFGGVGVLGVIALAITAVIGWKMLSDTSVIIVPKNWADSAAKQSQDQQQQQQPARLARP